MNLEQVANREIPLGDGTVQQIGLSYFALVNKQRIPLDESGRHYMIAEDPQNLTLVIYTKNKRTKASVLPTTYLP